MNSSPVISIVIVNYNVKDFLFNCINSIKRSHFPFPYELIVVDNNSFDGSVEFIKEKFPDVVLLPLEKNYGFGYANNVGFRYAKGKYVLILNPDTILQEDTLMVMYEYMENNPKVGIAGCKVLNPDGSLQLACRRGFPTPWTAFSKLFGLQALFPKSKIFGKYNQTYRDPNQTYFIDAISGSFMFVRKEVLEQTRGFDPDFFMFGEDLDLCYRAKELGWEVAYVHSTSIIHYKGESTKRSPIDEISHFYQAMEIFSKKHFAKSKFFLAFLQTGILLRKFLTKFWKHKVEIFFIVFDLFAINFSLLLASKIRFGDFLSFPDYAYPTVFIVISSITFLSMIATGEYFEKIHSPWRSAFALFISFFVLSSLTYFFKEYAFSRGVLLLTIGFTLVAVTTSRIIYSILIKTKGEKSPRRIAFIGFNEKTKNLISRFEESDTLNAQIVGIITTHNPNSKSAIEFPILGSIEQLNNIISKNQINEVIITDSSLNNADYLKKIQKIDSTNVRFHFAQEYEDLVASRILQEISGISPTIPNYNINKFRFRLIKRLIDIVFALFFLTFGFPIRLIYFSKDKKGIFNFLNVLIGKMTLVGVDKFDVARQKKPLISLADAYRDIHLSPITIEKLNQYYQQNYSPLLDLEVMFKYFGRRK